MSDRVRGHRYGPEENGSSHEPPAQYGEPTGWEIAEEMPVVIFYNGIQFGVMMMTPDNFEEFAIGFSLSEGIINSVSEIGDIRLENLAQGMGVNIIVPEEALKIARTRKRSIAGASSCGICGAQSLAIALPRVKKTRGFIPSPPIALKALKNLPAQQKLRQKNYSTHAAALANENGEILLLREDVGRHNSLDKLIGAMARAELSAKTGFLVLSSRYSVEMAQKSASFGFSFVACVSAPTSLALAISKKAAMKIGAQAETNIMIFD